ncbi:MAG: 50S ribosomal protein L9 [Flavobacteriales bacterium]|nr:50S ribosomal protein L9 [Flavobacteriales bacterium]
MEVILKQDVEHLGYADDVVKVREGYARNFLLPRGLATLATESARKQLTETLKQRAHKLAKIKDEAEKMAGGLGDKTLRIGAKVGENGRIFGSVNTIMIADALKAIGFEVDRKSIKLKGEAIKSIGNYEAEVTFHRDVIRIIPFEVVGEWPHPRPSPKEREECSYQECRRVRRMADPLSCTHADPPVQSVLAQDPAEGPVCYLTRFIG